MRRPVGSYGTGLPTATACSTVFGRMSSIRRAQGRHSPQLAGAHRLLSRLLVPFFKPTGECIATHAKDATDCSLRSAFAVSPEDFLFLLLGIATRLGIKHLVGTTVFTVILLRTASAVSVFDDVRGAALSTLVGLFDHRIDQAGEPDATQFNQKDSLLVEPLPDNIFYETGPLRKTRGGVLDFTPRFSSLKEARSLSDHLPVYTDVRWALHALP